MADKELLKKKVQYDRVAEEGTLPLPQILGNVFDDAFYSTSMIAELLGKSEETVRRWFRKGEIESFSPGHYRTSGKELKRFLYAKLKRFASH